MNDFNFTGRLAADAKIVNTGDKSFIAFTLFENKKDSKNIVKCTQTIKNGEEPAILKYLKKGTLILIQSTPHVKLEQDKDGNPVAVQCAYVNRIELLATKE
jgi:Single-strand binding protein family.